MMKQKDIVLIAIVIVFAGIASLVISNIFFSPDNKSLSAEVVDPITSEFQEPDEKVFNNKAINPTQLIEIGDSKNTQPF